MPTYVYRCEKCGNIDEVSHGMQDKPVLECSCGARALQRVFTPPNIVSKGAPRLRDMSRILMEDYGIASVSPIKRQDGQHNSRKRIFEEIKQRGSLVKEMMQAEKEAKAKQDKEKKESNRHTRQKLVKERIETIKDRKAKQEYSARRIHIV
jgi:putative FmdB family regulatory protein